MFGRQASAAREMHPRSVHALMAPNLTYSSSCYEILPTLCSLLASPWDLQAIGVTIWQAEVLDDGSQSGAGSGGVRYHHGEEVSRRGRRHSL